MSSFKTKKLSKNPRLQRLESYKIEERRISKPVKTPEKKSKKPRSIFRIFVWFLLIVSSILFLGILWIRAAGEMWLSNKIEEIKAFNPIISAINNSKWDSQNQKWSKNILIGGIGGKDHDGGELTDSLMVANLNYDKKTVTLLSIPRDLYVAYSRTTAGKINALYPMWQKSGEGVNYLAKKVSEITDQPIHHYMIIDFSGFKSIVDALGWVEVDVPNAIYDKTYPNNNWGYEVFSLKKWLQTLDGSTALKFARSRHSSSDFDRSHRQQLLIQAIKDKALSLGVLTNPAKISDLINSVRNNLSTDLTVGDLTDIALNFKDIKNENIFMYSINNECILGKWCVSGAFLYQPPINLFNTWTVIPEGASRSRLSKYDATQRYADLIFSYPSIKNQDPVIQIVTNSKNLAAAREIRSNLQKYGFSIDFANTIIQTGSTLENTKILSNKSFGENNDILLALKHLESKIDIEYTENNTYSENTSPKIEIIVGNDIKHFFNFGSYTPKIDPSANVITTTQINEKDIETNDIYGENLLQ